MDCRGWSRVSSEARRAILASMVEAFAPTDSCTITRLPELPQRRSRRDIEDLPQPVFETEKAIKSLW